MDTGNCNYRKAEEGDIPCPRCGYSRTREISGRLECGLTGHVAGTKMTCDCAREAS